LFESQLIFVYIFVSCLFTKMFPLRLKIRLKMPTLVMYKICLLNVGRWWKVSCLFTIVSWLFRFPFERGSCRMVFRLSRKIPCLRGSSCKECNWSIGYDNCCWEPRPIGRQLRWEIHKIHIWWWRVHSNLLRSRVIRLQDRRESWQRFFHNKRKQNIQDEKFCPWPSNNSIEIILWRFCFLIKQTHTYFHLPMGYLTIPWDIFFFLQNH